MTGAVHLFHYHLVTSQLRDVEARYLGKLGFDLVARYGRIGDEHVAVEPGVSWEKLDHDGFKLRLSELERGAVNVVVQPGHWRVPRVDHLGVALDEDDFQSVLGRAMQWNLRVQEHGGRRTFISSWSSGMFRAPGRCPEAYSPGVRTSTTVSSGSRSRACAGSRGRGVRGVVMLSCDPFVRGSGREGFGS